MLGMLIGGIVMIFTGISLCFSTVASGILTVGIGCIFMAIGLAGLVFVVWIVASLFPRFLRWFTDWCHRLLSKERMVRLYEKIFKDRFRDSGSFWCPGMWIYCCRSRYGCISRGFEV